MTVANSTVAPAAKNPAKSRRPMKYFAGFKSEVQQGSIDGMAE